MGIVLSSECRVRQLVAIVHTTPLNGRAPNASALRSDYRYTSSPPEGETPPCRVEGLIILQSIILFLYLRALQRCYTGAVGEVHPFADCMRLQGDNTPAED